VLFRVRDKVMQIRNNYDKNPYLQTVPESFTIIVALRKGGYLCQRNAHTQEVRRRGMSKRR
jgi:hypothetical protein